ncbi:MAG: hypothetical protein ACYDAJ_06865 [Nitrosotalea sp.]
MVLSEPVIQILKNKILDDVKDSQVIKPLLNDIVRRGTVQEWQTPDFTYAFTVGQMFTTAYTKASTIMNKPLSQEEKDQIFNLVSEIRTQI